jgi:hypothetical protein
VDVPLILQFSIALVSGMVAAARGSADDERDEESDEQAE